jgi:methyl-accepting chemotaxis protein-1 (serine sensor receptor)
VPAAVRPPVARKPQPSVLAARQPATPAKPRPAVTPQRKEPVLSTPARRRPAAAPAPATVEAGDWETF